MTLGVRNVPSHAQCVKLTGLLSDTLQRQYSKGPIAIVRWAQIVNAFLHPGPAVITALAESAQRAITAHNTSVQTDISASPAPSVADSGNDNESVEAGDDAVSSNEDSESEEDEVVEDRTGRKHSVVSVSTTISTKTETISPQPALRPSLSREVTESSDEEDDEDLEPEYAAALEELGPPPFYRSLLLLAEMSSKDNLFTPQYTAACQDNARRHKDFVMGFIAMRSLNTEKDDNFITMTPGVQLSAGGDALGQQYNTPRKVITEAGSDIIIVGRGILAAEDHKKMAQEYKKQGWMAYEERLRAGRRRPVR